MIIKKKIFFIVIGFVFLLVIFFMIGIFVEQKTDIVKLESFSKGMATGSAPQIMNTQEFALSDTSETSEIPSVDRKIIKTGNLSLEVENVTDTVAKIRSYTGDVGGFVVESRIEEREQIPYGSMMIRVPSLKFDEAFGSIKTLAKKVVEEFVSGEDITEEYYDVEAQLKNLEATESQFLQILKTAETVEDILAVHRELKDIRTQIDIIKGRLQYLDKSVNLSSLYISLSSDEAALPIVKEKDWHPIATVKNAARGLISTARIFLYGVIWIAIFAVIWIPFLFLIRYFWHRHKTRRL